MTALEERIAQRIQAEGPLPVSAFMAMALYDPAQGYYARRRPIGREGDYITAPEISQIFGELIGLWCADFWLKAGRPTPVILAELGPGRGVMAADLLRAAAAVPEFRRALRLCLVEASPILRAEQQRRLDQAANWVGSVDEIPPGPLIVVANEFLDALPLRQFVRGKGGWAERKVALDAGGRLVFCDGPESPAAAFLVPAPQRDSAPPGSIVEICPMALAVAERLARRFAGEPGAAIFIDYGRTSGPGPSSLRAFSRHRPVPPLTRPAEVDLSAAVDFVAIAAAGETAGARVSGPVSQRDFLLTLGIELRLQTLATRATADERHRLASGVARLIEPGGMGTLFQAMAFSSPGLPAPDGFPERGAP